MTAEYAFTGLVRRVKNMRLYLALLLVWAGMVGTTMGDVVFTVEQVRPGPITIGNSAVFEIFVRSDAGAISNLDGIDFSLNANDPAATGDSTVGGQFVSGTSDFYTPLTAPEPFQFPFPTSFQFFTATDSSGLMLGETNTLLATLTLDTAGATVGTYRLGLGDLKALDTGSAPLGISNLSSTGLDYQIVAIPEPSCVAIFGIAAFGLAARSRFRERRKV